MRVLRMAALCSLILLALAPIASAAPVFNWTGFYVGGNVGYSWGKADNTYHSVGNGNNFTQFDSPSINGAIGGGQAGYNYVFAPRWIVGLETDIQGSGEKSDGNRIACGPGGTCDTNTVTQSFSQKLHWFGTTRGRVGFLVDPSWMVYATGGIVYGALSRDDTYTNLTTTTVVGTSQSATKSGGVFGAGVEFVLWSNLTGRIEYLHFSLPGFDSMQVANGQLSLTQTTGRFTDDILRVGLNWRFGP